MIFPELGISAYAIDDLLFQDALLDRVEEAVDKLAQASREFFSMLVIGAPLRRKGQLFNRAVAIHRGAILGVVPKIHLPITASSMKRVNARRAPEFAMPRSK